MGGVVAGGKWCQECTGQVWLVGWLAGLGDSRG